MAERDYKKEYAKFQSSPEKKKYRAELNKYNRDKGTYGNGDGKDASHKGGKISGYENESKNRGRREKSRKKGSKRKTENVMPTLREFIVREATTELKERLAKRWNIVDSVGPQWDGETGGLRNIVDPDALRSACKTGDVGYIKRAIQQMVALKRGGNDDPSVHNALKNLLRIFIHVRKQIGPVNEAKLTGEQDKLIQMLRKKGPGWHDLLGTAQNRAAAQLASRPWAYDNAPMISYNYAMGQARLTETPVTITEAGRKDQHGGMYHSTHKGWDIWTLPTYTTPYYYATGRLHPKTFKRVFGPSDNYPGIRRLKNRMDKHLKLMGKDTLDEAEPAWGKPAAPSKADDAKASDPKPVPEETETS